MHVGFIGAGMNARTMARHILAAGHQVILSNSRGPDTLASVVAELGTGAKAGTREEVVRADIIILAVNWLDVRAAVAGIQWQGQILVDATNAHSASPPDMSVAGVARSKAALGGRTSSEVLAGWVPGARVVKAISNIPMAWIKDFSSDKPRTVIFASGDDQDAKQRVLQLLEDAGFAGVDLGSLAQGGAMQELGGPLSGLELHLVRRISRPG
jgi:8-hydroxy-5-deazaflavin:NADPH oxidoreductase